MTLQAQPPSALEIAPAGGRPRRAAWVMRLLWVGLGWACVLLGLIGMVLPLMPTTVFLLLAAWSFSRGSPRFHCWLTTHPHLGPPIRAWREHGAVSRQAKALAVVSLALSFGLAASMGAPVWALALCALCLSVVAAFLLTRPAPPRAR